MAYERIPLQARLDPQVDQEFSAEAKRRGMTRAGLARWLVGIYLSDTPTGRKLRNSVTTVTTPREAPEPRKPARRPTIKRTAPKPKKAPKKVSVTAGRCVHGNLGLCMDCAREKAATESG